LGGAYGGYAEGVEGTYANSGAPAVREPFSLRYVDYDVSGSLYAPAFFQTYDVENRCDPAGMRCKTTGERASSAVVAGLAGMIQVGRFGMSLSTDVQAFDLTQSASNPVTLRFGLVRLLTAYGFLNGQLAIGVGVRGVVVQMDQAGAGNLFLAAGASPEAGALIRPDNQPWRVGATVRAPVFSTDIGPGTAGGLILPRQVILPAEIEAGVSVQIGARPLNPPWIDPIEQQQPVKHEVENAREARRADHELAIAQSDDPIRTRERLEREEDAIRAVEEARLRRESVRLLEARRARYLNWPRGKLLVVAGALITAPVDDAISPIDFLDQQNTPFGRSWTASPRFGVESEPIPDRLMLRVGGYVEPTRFKDGVPRQHVTFGGDLKLFALGFIPFLKYTILRLTMSVDLAPRYTNWGVGLGVWH
jgi:hypothetical protein